MGSRALPLFFIDYYFDQKSLLTDTRHRRSLPYHDARQRMIASEAEKLLCEKPSRSLRNYPFDHFAAQRLHDKGDTAWIDRAVTDHWVSYLTEKDKLLNAVAETLEENGHSLAAACLVGFETRTTKLACRFDPLLAKAHDIVHPSNRKHQQKEGTKMKKILEAYGKFREQKTELKEKYKETIAPLQNERSAVFDQELVALTDADPTLCIPRDDFSLTGNLFAFLHQAEENTAKKTVAIDEQLEQHKAAHQFAKNRLRMTTARELGLSDLTVDVLKGVQFIGHTLKLAS